LHEEDGAAVDDKEDLKFVGLFYIFSCTFSSWKMQSKTRKNIFYFIKLFYQKF